MRQEIFSEIAIEEACKKVFALSLEIADIIVDAVPVSVAAHATLLKAKNNQLFLFIASQSGQTFGEVQKIVLRMQCEADHFYPPYGEAGYFERIAHSKFRAMFPGKHARGEDDLRYYKSLALYNPALVRIARVKGEIRGYDERSRAWRKVKEFNYNKINPVQ